MFFDFSTLLFHCNFYSFRMGFEIKGTLNLIRSKRLLLFAFDRNISHVTCKKLNNALLNKFRKTVNVRKKKREKNDVVRQTGLLSFWVELSL